MEQIRSDLYHQIKFDPMDNANWGKLHYLNVVETSRFVYRLPVDFEYVANQLKDPVFTFAEGTDQRYMVT